MPNWGGNEQYPGNQLDVITPIILVKTINPGRKTDPVATGVSASGIPPSVQKAGHKKVKKARLKFNGKALGWLRSERRVNN